MKHDLFYDLEAFDPKWQMHYRTIALAARAAGVLGMFSEWLLTQEGRQYREVMRGVPDTLELTRLAQEAADRLPYRMVSAKTDPSRYTFSS